MDDDMHDDDRREELLRRSLELLERTAATLAQPRAEGEWAGPDPAQTVIRKTTMSAPTRPADDLGRRVARLERCASAVTHNRNGLVEALAKVIATLTERHAAAEARIAALEGRRNELGGGDTDEDGARLASGGGP